MSFAVEAVGYAARIASAGSPKNRDIYIVQFCLVVLAPVLMAGVVYVVFGRIIFHVIPPKHRTLRLSVTSDSCYLPSVPLFYPSTWKATGEVSYIMTQGSNIP
jgi:hypothetical protein